MAGFCQVADIEGEQEHHFPSSCVVSPPAALFPLQRVFSRGETTLIFARLEEIMVSLIFKCILSFYWEKLWSGPILEGKQRFLENSPSDETNGVGYGFCTGPPCSPLQLEGRPGAAGMHAQCS